MDTVFALIVVGAVGAWIAIREARQRIRRILDEDGPRVDGDRPGRSENDPRGPSA